LPLPRQAAAVIGRFFERLFAKHRIGGGGKPGKR